MKDLQILEDHIANLSRAIDYIEANLGRPFVLQDVAREARMSLWHFQKVFHALVGEPVKSYVRRRRLTNVSNRLIESSASLESLAGVAGFKSAEAFSRAFQQQFGVTPGAFRSAGVYPLMPFARARLDKEYILAMFHQSQPPEVSIVEIPRKTLFGIRGQIHSCFSDTPDGTQIAPVLWSKLVNAVCAHSNISPVCYWALVSKAPVEENEIDEDIFDYVVTFESVGLSDAEEKELSKEFERNDFPGGTYATFEQRNPPESIRSNLNYLFCIWLRKSGYSLDDRPEFEKYALDYDPNHPPGTFTYGISLAR